MSLLSVPFFVFFFPHHACYLPFHFIPSNGPEATPGLLVDSVLESFKAVFSDESSHRWFRVRAGVGGELSRRVEAIYLHRMGINIIRFARHRPGTFCYSSLGVLLNVSKVLTNCTFPFLVIIRHLRSTKYRLGLWYRIRIPYLAYFTEYLYCRWLFVFYLQYLRYIWRWRRIRKALRTK